MSSLSDDDDAQETSSTSQPSKRLRLVLTSSSSSVPLNINDTNHNLQVLFSWHDVSNYFKDPPEPALPKSSTVTWRYNLAIIASVLTIFLSEDKNLDRNDTEIVSYRILLLYPDEQCRTHKWSALLPQVKKNVNLLVEKTIYLVREL